MGLVSSFFARRAGAGCAASAWDPALAEARVEQAVNKAAEICPGETVAWAAEARPDLLEKVFAAERHTDEAYRAEDMAGLEAALGEYLEACRALAEEYATATDHARREWAAGECPVERVVVDRRAGVLTLEPRGGVSQEDWRAFEEWMREEFGLVGVEIGWAEDLSPARPGEKGQLVLFPGAGGEQEQQEGFRSPWQDWLDRVEVIRVGDLAAWRAVLEEARAAGVCGVDTETTSTLQPDGERRSDPLLNRIRLVQLAVPTYSSGKKHLVAEDGRTPEPESGARSYVLDLFTLSEAERREALELLAGLVADRQVVKVFHNAKFDLGFLRTAVGRRLPVERIFDVMLASQLVTAGDHVIYAHLPRYCQEHGLRGWITPKERQTAEYRRARMESGAGKGTVPMLDAHGHWILWEVSSGREEETRPWYPTHRLSQLTHRHLEVQLDKDFQNADWGGEITEDMIRYAAVDAVVLLPLREIFIELLKRNKLIKVAEIEFSCLPATVEVETSGMPFDACQARELLRTAEEEANRHREALTQMAAEAGFRPRSNKKGSGKKEAGFNPDSSQDVIECLRLLAEAEGVLAGEKLVAGGEEFEIESRDETLLRLLARLPEGNTLRRFAEELRGYRAAKKRSDFLRDWLEKLHPATDRLHPDLRQLNPNGVGRFSAKDPNLQQAPRGSEIRQLFRAPDGRKLVVADYSAVEMRIMAQLSEDKTMRQAFMDGVDIHRFTAARIAGKAPDEVSKEERQAAKAFNFGLIYGMQGKTLQQYAETNYGVKMSLEEAEAAREAFFRTYPAIAAWHRRQDRRGYEDGFEAFYRHDWERGFYIEKRPCVRTQAGRLRVWPVVEKERKNGEGSYLRKVGSFTELYNTPDQGTGADILKSAMAQLYRELLNRGWEEVRLVATVHDELVLEAPADLAEEAAALLKQVMEEAGARFLPDVPVEVEAAVCASWAEKG